MTVSGGHNNDAFNNDEQERISPTRDASLNETLTVPGGHNNDAFNNDEQERISPTRDASVHETLTVPGGHNNDAFNSQHDTYDGNLSGKFGKEFF